MSIRRAATAILLQLVLPSHGKTVSCYGFRPPSSQVRSWGSARTAPHLYSSCSGSHINDVSCRQLPRRHPSARSFNSRTCQGGLGMSVYLEEERVLAATEEVVIRSTETTESLDDAFVEQRRDFGSFFAEVAAGSFLVTSNTIGAGLMILPDVFAGPGFLPSSGLLLGTYVINLISGLLIAEVAIKQHETSGYQVPSSFKEFTDINFNSKEAGTVVAMVSVFFNWCTLAFAFVRVGGLASEAATSFTLALPEGLLGVFNFQSLASFVAAMMLATTLSTQGSKILSVVASASVFLLLSSFAVLLIPGLLSVHDPVGTILSHGSFEAAAAAAGSNLVDAIGDALPIIYYMTCYQNIVPSMTKLLKYDRVKSTAAIVFGSFLPLLMYLGWCYAVLGGGIDTSITGGGGLAFTAFSLSSIVGASVGGLMSVVEELECFFPSSDVDPQSDGLCVDEPFSSVSLAFLGVLPPLIVGIILAGGDNCNAALRSAGGLASPFLYGLVPAALGWMQRTTHKVDEIDVDGARSDEKDMIGGGTATLTLLTLTSVGLIAKVLMDLFLS